MVSDIFLELVRLNPFQKGIACRNRSEITDFMENFQNLVKKWQKMAKNQVFSAPQAFFHPRTEFFIPYALYTCPESGIWPGTLNSKIEPTRLYNIHCISGHIKLAGYPAKMNFFDSISSIPYFFVRAYGTYVL